MSEIDFNISAIINFHKNIFQEQIITIAFLNFTNEGLTNGIQFSKTIVFANNFYNLGYYLIYFLFFFGFLQNFLILFNIYLVKIYLFLHTSINL